MTNEPEELSAFGDAEMSTEELSSLQRRVSFKRPKPQKRRSLRDLRATMSDTEGILPERETQVRFEESEEQHKSAVSRSLSVGGNRISELRRLTTQLDASQDRVESLEKELKIFEGAQQSLVQEAERWKRKQYDTSRELDQLRNEFDQQQSQLNFMKQEMEKLQNTVHAKEREKQTLNRQFDDGLSLVEKSKGEWDSKEASYKHQIATLTKAVNQLKDEVAQEKENQLRSNRDHQQRETEAQAHVIMIKTLEAEHKKLAEEANEALAFEQRRRRASFGPSGCPEHDKMIDELQATIKSLAEQNQSLQEEVETLRVLITDTQTSPSLTPAPAPISPTPPSSAPGSPTGKGKPRFPPRTSSAQDLLTMYTNGQSSGSLATELLREKVQTGVKSELTRLRDENIALVNYLAATLDSVAKLR
ncbi:hypothetical protein HDV00_009266 [Rhizophlyctis rosea]|nr:hypothetical protein HDV00_009266 [Rhizophlyctis rosea]